MEQITQRSEYKKPFCFSHLAGVTFALYTSLSTLGGGGWQTRPPFKDTLWRITNLQYTPAPWEVSELSFFGDRVCSHKLEGVMISTDHVRNLGECYSTSDASYTCDENAAMRVTDGQVETLWRAKCGVGRATCTGLNCGCELFLYVDALLPLVDCYVDLIVIVNIFLYQFSKLVVHVLVAKSQRQKKPF